MSQWNKYCYSSDHYFVTNANGTSALSCEEAATGSTKQIRVLGKAGLLMQNGMKEDEAFDKAEKEVYRKPQSTKEPNQHIPSDKAAGDNAAQASQMCVPIFSTPPNPSTTARWWTSLSNSVTPPHSSTKILSSTSASLNDTISDNVNVAILTPSPRLGGPRTAEPNRNAGNTLDFAHTQRPTFSSLIRDESDDTAAAKARRHPVRQLKSSNLSDDTKELLSLSRTPSKSPRDSPKEGSAGSIEARKKSEGYSGDWAAFVDWNGMEDNDTDAGGEGKKRKRQAGDSPKKTEASVRRKVGSGDDA